MTPTEVTPQKIFRASALERQFSSPGRLDELIDVVRPADWAAVGAVWLCLAVLLSWGVLGQIPTRVSGEGILFSDGKVADAVSVVEGRLASLEVAVGDRVSQGQVIARIAQTEIEQRFQGALEARQEREREYTALVAANQREATLKSANILAQQTRLKEIVTMAEERESSLATTVHAVEGLVGQKLLTTRELDDRRAELNLQRQRIVDAQTEIERLNAQKLDLEAQHERDRLTLEIEVSDARRQAEELRVELERDSRVLAPMSGRVVELKVSNGAVLQTGSPLVSIAANEGGGLRATVYVAADKAKTVTPGMRVRVTPSTVKREEYGTLVGVVTGISEFPVTSEGMASQLHNDSLVVRFEQIGSPHAIEVALHPDPATASGYQWSSGAGPAIRLSAGTLVEAQITTREQPPLTLIVPLMKRLSGTD
jgi:HlyD family secretion protein